DDVHARNELGETALHLAARFNHERAVELLLRHGADANAQSAGRSSSKDENAIYNHGWTPLHEACEQGNMAVVRQLLASRARMDLRTKTGQSAVDLARENGHRLFCSSFKRLTSP